MKWMIPVLFYGGLIVLFAVHPIVGIGMLIAAGVVILAAK